MIEQIRNIYFGKSLKIRFTPTFIFCSPICPNNYGVVFYYKKTYFILREIIFSFDHSNMQISTVNITRVV